MKPGTGPGDAGAGQQGETTQDEITPGANIAPAVGSSGAGNTQDVAWPVFTTEQFHQLFIDSLTEVYFPEQPAGDNVPTDTNTTAAKPAGADVASSQAAQTSGENSETFINNDSGFINEGLARGAFNANTSNSIPEFWAGLFLPVSGNEAPSETAACGDGPCELETDPFPVTGSCEDSECSQESLLPTVAVSCLYGQCSLETSEDEGTVTQPGFTLAANGRGDVSEPVFTPPSYAETVIASIEEPITLFAENSEPTPQQLGEIATAAGGLPQFPSELIVLGPIPAAPGEFDPVTFANNPFDPATNNGILAGDDVLNNFLSTPVSEPPICTEEGQTNCLESDSVGSDLDTFQPDGTNSQNDTETSDSSSTSSSGSFSGSIIIGSSSSSSTDSSSGSSGSAFRVGSLSGGFVGRIAETPVIDVGADTSASFGGGVIGPSGAGQTFTLDPDNPDIILSPTQIGIFFSGGQPIVFGIDPGFFTFSEISGQTVSGDGVLSPSGSTLFANIFFPSSGNRMVISGGPVLDDGDIPTTGTFPFQIQPDFLLNNSVVGLRQDTAGNIVGGGAGIAFINLDGDPRPQFGGGRLAIRNQGTSQRSSASLLVGDVRTINSGSNISITARLRATARDGTEPATYRIDSDIISTPGAGFLGEDSIELINLQADGVTREFQLPGAANAITYNPNIIATASNTSVGNRTRTQMWGHAAGLAENINSAGDVDSRFLVENADGASAGPVPGGFFPNDVDVKLDPVTGHWGAGFNLSDLNGASSSGSADSLNVNIHFGCSSAPCLNTSAFIDDNTFVAREDQDIAVRPGSTLKAFDSGGFLATPNAARFYAMTGDFLDTFAFLPPGVSFCDCEYLVWGLWGGGHIDEINNREVRFHMGTFAIADDICNGCTLPNGGSAIYIGHAMGSVLNNGEHYLAVGRYQQNVTFSGGNAHVSDIMLTKSDGQDYTISGVNGNGGSFSAQGTSGTRLLTIHASFAGVGGSTAGGIVGGLKIINTGGTSYATSGTIVAKTATPP